MTGRRPSRLLAPLALVVTAVALYSVVTSDGGGTAEKADGSATPTATSTAAGKGSKKKTRKTAKTYTVKPGDTPSGIAQKLGVSLDDLLAANPDADPNALTPGQKLKLP